MKAYLANAFQLYSACRFGIPQLVVVVVVVGP